MMTSSQAGARVMGRWCLIASIALYAIAYTMTHLPPNRVPGTGWFNDKLLHATGYTALGLMTFLTLMMRNRRRTWTTVVGTWAWLIGYAFFDEATQPLVGRDFEWNDLAADGAGALLGIVIVFLVIRRWK